MIDYSAYLLSDVCVKEDPNEEDALAQRLFPKSSVRAKLPFLLGSVLQIAKTAMLGFLPRKLQERYEAQEMQEMHEVKELQEAYEEQNAQGVARMDLEN